MYVLGMKLCELNCRNKEGEQSKSAWGYLPRTNKKLLLKINTRRKTNNNFIVDSSEEAELRCETRNTLCKDDFSGTHSRLNMH
jgi:hypothetical protein